jgi:hypothetical protein
LLIELLLEGIQLQRSAIRLQKETVTWKAAASVIGGGLAGMFSPPVAYWREQCFRSSERARQTPGTGTGTGMAEPAVRAFCGERVC